MTRTIIIIVVVVALLLLIGLLLAARNRRKKELARQRADELRQDAGAATASTKAQEARARETEAEALAARERAERLQAEAEERRTEAQAAHAKREDAVREADRLDPDVDHKAADYEPRLDAVGGDHDRSGQHDQHGDTHAHDPRSGTSGTDDTGTRSEGGTWDERTQTQGSHAAGTQGGQGGTYGDDTRGTTPDTHADPALRPTDPGDPDFRPQDGR